MQWIETTSESSVRDETQAAKIPARALTDADIQNLPNYVAAEWEILLICLWLKAE